MPIYLGIFNVPKSITTMITNVTKTITIIVSILSLIAFWGAALNPIFTLISVIIASSIFILVLILRHPIADLFSGLELSWRRQVRTGDFIGLESGQIGELIRITWRNITIKTPEGHLVIIPNRKLIENTLTTYNNASGATNEEDEITEGVRNRRPANGRLESLSSREREVLILVGKGAKNPEIAKDITVSVHTVKSHIRSIMNKLNLKNRQQIAVYAEREGLLPSDSFEDDFNHEASEK